MQEPKNARLEGIEASVTRAGVKDSALGALIVDLLADNRRLLAGCDRLVERAEKAEQENERHRRRNLVRSVVEEIDNQWIIEAINAEDWDVAPWIAARRLVERAEAAEEAWDSALKAQDILVASWARVVVRIADEGTIGNEYAIDKARQLLGGAISHIPDDSEPDDA